ncbi:TIGR03862 family flavoprotein [Thalassococcus lentus]|uniref:TIGR03862 family flavoprotein n=1 Tax=Thalassococcus lentus TaxID=1210524 RepID=A0ABT4XTA5_9RHOB|nr:TIGR03862 family flavoprotein [Thalassococcus lentus]MDA7425184.1 TIGR03862 family flavoprotein [Thalassococcus lentus]
MKPALVIGGGPAGLMAADALLGAGVPVVLAEAKPSVGRKFLMAGKSGLNLTKIQDRSPFLSSYGETGKSLGPMLEAFPPEQVQAWAEGLGQDTFVGSTGRLFPKKMKASPLLRAWLERLDALGLERRTRWRWTGWDGDLVQFDTPIGVQTIDPCATVLALGGASWSRLGSDGAWTALLRDKSIDLELFAPSNAGLIVDWSEHMRPHFGTPIKAVRWTAGGMTSRGEAIISERGLEGGGLYPLTAALRKDEMLFVDLCPDLNTDQVAERLAKPRGKTSMSNHLRRQIKLGKAQIALLMEFARPLAGDPAALAQQIKSVEVRHKGPRPMDEAISTTGGISWAALDDSLMLKGLPGVFCAGEMIDWDAPTGGYLLNACLATGLWAGQRAALYCQA